MSACLQWATAAVAALAMGTPPPPVQGAAGCEAPDHFELVRHAVGWDAPVAGGLQGIKHHAVGVRRLATGEAKAALASFEAAAEQQPELLAAWIGQAVAAGRTAQPDRARAAAAEVAKLAKGRAGVGDADLRVFAVDELLAAALQGVISQAAPGCAPCWRHLGDAYAIAARRRPEDSARPWWRKAADSFQRALAATPGDDVLRSATARALAAGGWLESARGVLQAGVDASPAWTDGRRMLGKVLLELHRPADALPHLRAARDWPGEGAALRGLGRSGEAAEAYAAALKEGQGDPAAVRVGLFLSREQAGLPADPRLLEQALLSAPDDLPALYALARHYQDNGQEGAYEAVIERYQRARNAAEERLEGLERTLADRRARAQSVERMYERCIEANR